MWRNGRWGWWLSPMLCQSCGIYSTSLAFALYFHSVFVSKSSRSLYGTVATCTAELDLLFRAGTATHSAALFLLRLTCIRKVLPVGLKNSLPECKWYHHTSLTYTFHGKYRFSKISFLNASRFLHSAFVYFKNCWWLHYGRNSYLFRDLNSSMFICLFHGGMARQCSGFFNLNSHSRYLHSCVIFW